MSDPMIDGLVKVIESLKPSAREKLIERLIESHMLSENEEDPRTDKRGGKHPLPRSSPTLIKRKGAKAQR